MTKLPFCIVLLHSLLLGIQPARAKDSAWLPHSPVSEEQRVDGKYNEPQSSVWVVKDNTKPERQPFVWVVEDPKQASLQPVLQVVKDTSKPQSLDSLASKEAKQSDFESFDKLVKDTSMLKGLFTLYRQKKTDKIYLAVKQEQLNKNFLSTGTLESGIGERGIYSGMPLQDFLFYFRRVNNNLHFVIRNVNFRANPGDPQTRSLNRSFSDSVLYSIPIRSIEQKSQTIVIELDDLLLKDLPGLSSQLSSVLGASYKIDEDKSYFGDAKGFPLNMEIESVYGFSSNRTDNVADVPTLPDNRALTLRVRYSISQLPQNNYQPRLADERVGYFITAYQDFSNDNRNDPFVRYINRWHLEKKNPKAPLSPPKKPIVFWIENAVPLEYRDAIKEGVLMWNQAFKKAGFKDAIEVWQMPDNATWDPADVRYNTIRWINTVDGFFAMGPARVNPLTGEILDADIIVDASFVRSLKGEYRTLVKPNQSQSRTSLSQLINSLDLCTSSGAEGRSYLEEENEDNSHTQSERSISPDRQSHTFLSSMAKDYDICYGMESSRQFAVGSLALSLQNTFPRDEDINEYIRQYLRLVIAHEVGHTLGLRHNFRGSTLLQPEDLNNTKITRSLGLTTSVMDYIPPNLAPQGKHQGDFFPTKVGPYDEWAIHYGYTPSGVMHPLAERRFLEQIAQLSSKKRELSYAPDEDMFDLDPTVNAWDNSGDVLHYSQWQLDNSRAMWTRLNKRYPIPGESYSKLSELFDTVLFHYLRHIHYITKYIGGQSFYRNRAGDSDGLLPFEAVPVEKQRQALATLQNYIFAPTAFDFPPQLLNKLAPSRWKHWGEQVVVGRLDYPVHNSIQSMQGMVLRDLLSSDRLNRLRDIELKNQPERVLGLPELFDTLQNGIWTEVLQPNDKQIEISSLRRALQREYLDILAAMVLRTKNVPEDARTLAWYKLNQLQGQLNKRIAHSGKMDEYTKAHLEETSDRISKTLNAQMQSR